MTTSFDTDSNTQTIAADSIAQTVATGSNTQTAASAWASSPLGQPDHEIGYGFAPEPHVEAEAESRRRPVAKQTIVAAALACGIGGGAALGLMFFDFGPQQPTVTVPATAPDHAVVVTDNPSPSGVQPAPSAPTPVTGHVGTSPARVPGGPSVAPTSANPQEPAPEPQQDPQAPAP